MGKRRRIDGVGPDPDWYLELEPVLREEHILWYHEGEKVMRVRCELQWDSPHLLPRRRDRLLLDKWDLRCFQPPHEMKVLGDEAQKRILGRIQLALQAEGLDASLS